MEHVVIFLCINAVVNSVMLQLYLGESRLLWGGVLFHTRRCCTLLKQISKSLSR